MTGRTGTLAGMDGRRTGALAEAGRLVLPVECAGCGRWDTALCEDCAALLRRRPRRCEQAAALLAGSGPAPGLPTWSAGPYRGALRAMVLAWKNQRRPDIETTLLAGAREMAAAWAGDPDLRALLRAAPGTGTVLVLPAPSGTRRRLARRLVVADLAGAVAAGLARSGMLTETGVSEVLVADLLRRRGGRDHQAGIGARGRAENRRGRIRCRTALPRGVAVVLVDDVVTTGATLAACAEAVRAAGGEAIGALALASTPAPAVSPRGDRY